MIGPGALGAKLYGLTAAAMHDDDHESCNVGAFCRNPLHPGPCKGWRKGLATAEEIHAPKVKAAPAKKAAKVAKKAVAKVAPSGPAPKPVAVADPPKTSGPKAATTEVDAWGWPKADNSSKAATPAAASKVAPPKAAPKKRAPAKKAAAPVQAPPSAKPDPAEGKTLPPVAHRQVGRDQMADSPSGFAAQVAKDWDKQVASDQGLAAIGARQGFDQKPRVVSKAELDAMVADGHPQIFRGVKNLHNGPTGAEIHEQMRSGHAYYGTGIYGNGYYWGEASHAKLYADGRPGSTARGVLDKNAKVIDYWKDLEPEHTKFLEALKGHPNEEEMRGVYGDPGRYAASRGYDAILISPDSRRAQEGLPPTGEKPWYNVLNRTATVVQEADQ